MTTPQQVTASLWHYAGAIDDECDRLNTILEMTQEFLAGLHIGREFHIDLGQEEPDNPAVANAKEGTNYADGEWPNHFVCFRKWGGKWEICYAVMPCVLGEPTDGYGEIKSIRQCSRDERIYTARALPRLLARAKEVADSVREEVGDAADIALRALKEAKRTGDE